MAPRSKGSSASRVTTHGLIEVANRTSKLYDDLPREYRPRGSAKAETGDAPSGELGEVALAAVAPDDPDVQGWLELLAETPHSAASIW